MPKVSVIMAVYNGEKYIGEAIESILNQTLRDFEFIIVNDASTDNTETIVRTYLEKDSRITLLNNEVNNERSFSRNRGIEIAQGEYVAIIDADDICHPEKLEKQVSFLEKNKFTGFVGTAYQLIDEHNRVTSDIECPGSHIEATLHIVFAFPTILARKKCFDDMEGYRSVFEPAEDYDLWLRIFEKCGAGIINEPLYQYRVHGASSTIKQKSKMDISVVLVVVAAEERKKTGRDSFTDLSQDKANAIRNEMLLQSNQKTRRMFSLRYLVHSRAAYALHAYKRAYSYARMSLTCSLKNTGAWIMLLKSIVRWEGQGIARSLLLSSLQKSKLSFFRNIYWNSRAQEIHDRWGEGTDDFQVLREVLDLVKPQRVLDIGCGSGRCFPLYQGMNIPEVIGQDVSAHALDICRGRFTDLHYRLFQGDIKDLDFGENYFDLVISTRVLAAMHPEHIDLQIAHLCRLTKFMYLNEMSDTDYVGPSNYWFMHDYEKLLSRNNFSIVKRGTIQLVEDEKNHLQTWVLYRKS